MRTAIAFYFVLAATVSPSSLPRILLGAAVDNGARYNPARPTVSIERAEHATGREPISFTESTPKRFQAVILFWGTGNLVIRILDVGLLMVAGHLLACSLGVLGNTSYYAELYDEGRCDIVR